VTGTLWPVRGPWPAPGGADRSADPVNALVTPGGDDGTRTHDPLLAKQVL
jgi:hypothetical protein